MYGQILEILTNIWMCYSKKTDSRQREIKFMSTFVSIKSDDETTLVELIHEIHTKKMQQLSRVVEEYSNLKNKN